ncbi:hypothetical protein [Paenibacillus tundrae]|uniref:Uncharacterized protein n=1 Tax=Paenibacillus tundrae TaxID=528187 RepID=A0ABT9WGU5_9BACL|nr:hypothetical protein [Paenibacillus tundrae]MDQ0172400.1 hypothetical protein [Paenibacillus tundrae]
MIEGFWYYLNNYKEDHPEDFNKDFSNVGIDLISIKVTTISLTLNFRYDEIVEYVTCFLMIEYEGEEIGEYESLFTLNGEDLDDYLRISK